RVQGQAGHPIGADGADRGVRGRDAAAVLSRPAGGLPGPARCAGRAGRGDPALPSRRLVLLPEGRPQDHVSETRYAEPGAKWTVLLYGPGFAVLGFLVETLTGPAHTVAWILAGLGLAAITAPWVYARRRFLSVRLTASTLW